MPLRVFAFLLTILVLAAPLRAQSPVDSSWTLDHGDTLLFHHDATREYVRANGTREVRFPDGRRLHFFTPDHFIEKRAFSVHNFQELNSIATPTHTVLTCTMSIGWGTPVAIWSSFPSGDPRTTEPAAVTRNRACRFSIPFDEPGWHTVELVANGPDRIKHIVARILICVGDHLPLPFDTVVERHGPEFLPRTNDRVFTFLTMDRGDSLTGLAHDSLRDEAASILVSAAVTQKLQWAILSPARARQMLGSMSGFCDSSVRGVVLALGHTPEGVAWNLWTSPTMRSFGLLRKAKRVSVGIMRVGNELESAIMLSGPR